MTTIEELISLAEEVSRVKAKLMDDAIQSPVMALRKVGNDAARAWSGSNIGYHATVYYRGLQPKPPMVQFSAEWGLQELWPTNEPDHGWEIMDHKVVFDELARRAGVGDPDELNKAIHTIRERFTDLKNEAVSILSAFVSVEPDSFLQGKLGEVEKLKAPAGQTLVRQQLPSSYTSRDSLAMHQGLRSAPHQLLGALSESASYVGSSLDSLEKVVRLSAAHIQRIAKGRQRVKNNGQTVFIGHGRSLTWLELKSFLSERLNLPADEFNRVPTAGVSTINRLSAMLDVAAFAFLIMTAEDEQPDGKIHARQNVIHEAGLFQGRLGFEKAIILLEEGCEEFSNIHGLGQVRFSQGKISSCFEEIRRVLEREKLI